MSTAPITLDLADAEATAALGRALAGHLSAGDTVLLEGSVGAGKTHLARALIQSVLEIPEDVPSPTFTLVQTYETTRGALWHADLYRLTDASEVEELGLTEAFDTAICLIEWPDRLGDTPSQALILTLEAVGDARRALFRWTGGHWADTLQEVLSHV